MVSVSTEGVFKTQTCSSCSQVHLFGPQLQFWKQELIAETLAKAFEVLMKKTYDLDPERPAHSLWMVGPASGCGKLGDGTSASD